MIRKTIGDSRSSYSVWKYSSRISGTSLIRSLHLTIQTIQQDDEGNDFDQMDFDDGPAPPNLGASSSGFAGHGDSFDDFQPGREGHGRKGKGHAGHHDEKIVDQNFFNCKCSGGH